MQHAGMRRDFMFVLWFCVPTGFDGMVEFRSHKDPAFDLTRKEADIGLQVRQFPPQGP